MDGAETEEFSKLQYLCLPLQASTGKVLRVDGEWDGGNIPTWGEQRMGSLFLPSPGLGTTTSPLNPLSLCSTAGHLVWI